MTTETTATHMASTRPRGANGDESSTVEMVQAAAREVRSALEGASRSVPDVARASRAAVDDLVHAIEAGSDERVSAGVTLSLGVAIGMLIGGAPRLLIVLALAPVAVMGLALADRQATRARTTS